MITSNHKCFINKHIFVWLKWLLGVNVLEIIASNISFLNAVVSSPFVIFQVTQNHFMEMVRNQDVKGIEKLLAKGFDPNFWSRKDGGEHGYWLERRKSGVKLWMYIVIYQIGQIWIKGRFRINNVTEKYFLLISWVIK